MKNFDYVGNANSMQSLSTYFNNLNYDKSLYHLFYYYYCYYICIIVKYL